MKHNNNNCLLILQVWPVKPCKNQKKSALENLTEELSRTDKVKRRKKVLAGKEHASINFEHCICPCA